MLTSIETRRSIRKYEDRPVEDEKTTAILESARWAPSGNNTQPWHFIVIQSQEMREKVAAVSHQQKWMLTAPVHIACVADLSSRITGHPEVVLTEVSSQHELKQVIRDTAIAAEHLVLEAENQGLGTCWVAWFTQEEIRPVLGIPDDKYVVAVITVGYPAHAPAPTPRKKLSDIVRWETW
ncbi:nitroreductase family protein [Anoxynatronum sibiricum]|uniref:Nitroreductase family protein n=1 Tax=Anoxynatronum sibiricum TaxID=210623 RepID=A0ABU9VTM5_9CLOT